ncbi:peptidoglycan editing factor PgeF [Marinomonas posidonica]|uniref:Purine nucleoside phosphorylase n=1 Tax=Marinomonas posidonica (strain CECT 7376 / NCIMB 14433 / IVIA-Po-181) TaxID=491952 RepID=F6D126_MARPP|nr:peptidoglycan editing factor PgeF [Marinomonas posidonica]AEF53749.1 Multi-copper polyphenol oxidoreductase, laccase [Marinomonas posidonica IVIA-Po-181]
MSGASYISPNWPAPPSVKGFVSTRLGGVSQSPFNTLNLGAHVGDEPQAVVTNRGRFAQQINMPESVVWLNQVHGTQVIALPTNEQIDAADAAYSNSIGQVCAVLTADCLPVFFCDSKGHQVAVAHAGWRGLCAGILESTLAKFDDPEQVMAWLGPAIGPSAFEVGQEVYEAFCLKETSAHVAFKPSAEGKWLADLYTLARQRLKAVGVEHVYGGDYCTYTDEERFFSYRRDGQTGRMASVVWIEA